ncbi:MAG: LLM class flavin-dependent oxidoreductase [Gammaproteobacteria bacterium]
MKFGFSTHMRYPKQFRTLSWSDLYRAEIDIAVYAEELGFDTCWVYEHHFTEPEGHLPSPMAVCAAIAARTKRIEIGPNLILPLHDPVLIAEEAAVIDLLSAGRFVLGLVQGYREREYGAWGIPTSERGPRLSEAVDIIRKCWSGERFDYEGKFWKYRDVCMDPPPAHDIPILYGARAPAGLRRAARDRVGIISQGPGMESPRFYAEQCKQEGWGPGEVRHLRYFVIDDDPEKAWAEMRPYAENMMKVYDQWFQNSKDTGVTQVAGKALNADALLQDDLYIVGTPEHAVERIKKLKAEYPDVKEVWGLFAFPGLPHDKVAKSMELFARKVMPQVR